MCKQHDRHIIIGRISGVYGVQGWVKVLSYTRPKENIFKYTCWLLRRNDQWFEFRLDEGKGHGKGLIANLHNVTDRDAAGELIKADIAVYREQLPDLDENKYYWCDLIGLEVINQESECLGTVTDVTETVANDVLIVEGAHRWLIPVVWDVYVINVDLEQARIVVDWDTKENVTG